MTKATGLQGRDTVGAGKLTKVTSEWKTPMGELAASRAARRRLTLQLF